VNTTILIVSLSIFTKVHALAQQAPDPAQKIRAAMQASLDQQQASVRKQVESLRSAVTVSISTEVPCDAVPEAQLTSLIDDAANREDLQSNLIRAVVQKESAGRPCAVSPKGAQGLMQIMPATASQFSVSDAFDPKQNIDAGTKFLKQLLMRYAGDVPLALGAYNAGPGRVDKQGGVPEIQETQNYISEILLKLKDIN
jgi:soluble lytic murein transglycosylase-like protein